MKLNPLLVVSVLFLFSLACGQITSCEVLIAGGTTAAFSAAISSAREGARTCLLEPTDWVGGQLTASGVPAVDFAWHKLTDPKTGKIFDVAKYDRAPENNTPDFLKALKTTGNTGACWVSIFCFLPKELLKKSLLPLQESVSHNLQVFLNTVVKSVEKDQSGKITSITAIQRTPKEGVACDGYDDFLSNDLLDWYSPNPSPKFDKKVLRFDNSPVVVEATEWGELLALAETKYLQASAEQFDGDTSGAGNDTCGQSTVFGFAQYLSANDVVEPPNPLPVHHPEYYSMEKYTQAMVWSYRRLNSKGNNIYQFYVNDTTLQNWGKGNDYAFGYLFKSREEAQRDVATGNWYGGVDLKALQESESLAYGWHYFFKNYNTTLSQKISLDKEAFGTCHGLSKLPYIRDTRRSIGLGGFVMKVSDISGDFTKSPVGTIFPDAVAIGCYNVDIHPVANCSMPSHVFKHYDILPFFIPFRAMTNQDVPNMVVAGKTMAQSFLTNAATRLHPVEWNSGTAAGVAAAFMANNKIYDTSIVYAKHIQELQARVEEHTPIRWTIEGRQYPPQSSPRHATMSIQNKFKF